MFKESDIFCSGKIICILFLLFGCSVNAFKKSELDEIFNGKACIEGKDYQVCLQVISE